MGSDESFKTNNSAPNGSSVHDSLRTHSSLPESGRTYLQIEIGEGGRQEGKAERPSCVGSGLDPCQFLIAYESEWQS